MKKVKHGTWLHKKETWISTSRTRNLGNRCIALRSTIFLFRSSISHFHTGYGKGVWTQMKAPLLPFFKQAEILSAKKKEMQIVKHWVLQKGAQNVAWFTEVVFVVAKQRNFTCCLLRVWLKIDDNGQMICGLVVCLVSIVRPSIVSVFPRTFQSANYRLIYHYGRRLLPQCSLIIHV